MIFLAIDDMLTDEWGMLKSAKAKDAWLQPSSSFRIHHSALLQCQQDRRDDDMDRLERIHRQAGDE